MKSRSTRNNLASGRGWGSCDKCFFGWAFLQLVAGSGNSWKARMFQLRLCNGPESVPSRHCCYQPRALWKASHPSNWPKPATCAASVGSLPGGIGLGPNKSNRPRGLFLRPPKPQVSAQKWTNPNFLARIPQFLLIKVIAHLQPENGRLEYYLPRAQGLFWCLSYFWISLTTTPSGLC